MRFFIVSMIMAFISGSVMTVNGIEASNSLREFLTAMYITTIAIFGVYGGLEALRKESQE